MMTPPIFRWQTKTTLPVWESRNQTIRGRSEIRVAYSGTAKTRQLN